LLSGKIYQVTLAPASASWLKSRQYLNMNENWVRIQSIFLEALNLRPEDRASFLDAACDGDAEIRREVESLLAHDSSPELISEAIAGTARSLLETVTVKPGATIGDYKVVKLIGSGGMGEVYQSRDVRLARDVAIKVLPPFFTNHPDRLRRFEQEARAAAALNHPNILAVYQMGLYHGVPYLVSELLEGSTLREVLKRGLLSPRSAIDYGVQIAHGLAAAHEKGITHRDLKPENLFVTNDGRIKILDFGLAKLADSAIAGHQGPETEAGLVMGTVGYMSPEQIRGQAVDYRSDFFALGAVLHELLCGQPAFTKATAADTLSAILNEDPANISQILPATPPGLGRVVRRCLEKNKEQRFQSASDLAFALEALSDPAMMVPGDSRSAGWEKLWKVAIPLSVAALLLAGTLSYRYYRSNHQARRLTDKDTTVIADFANTTGDPVFDDALKTALSVSLRQSPFLNVLSDNKVMATLKLMARPAGTPLRPDIAREVCQRAGSKAYIAGSIATLGSEYVLGLKVVNCANGDVLAEDQVTATSKEKVLSALGEAASRLRTQLGESLATVQSFDVPLPSATTSSLEALKAYSLGVKALGERGPAEGLPYFQRAIELDPSFAVGYSALGDDYNSQGEVGRATEYYAKAFELRAHTSEREKLGIEANYYFNVTGELDKAARAYQGLIESHPEDSRPFNELGNVLTGLGEYEKAADAYQQSMRLDPNSTAPYSNLGNTSMATGQFSETRQMIRDAHAKSLDDYILHAQAYTLAFLSSDASAMAEEQKWFTGRAEENDGLSLASDTEAYSGHLREARQLTRLAVNSSIRADSKETGAVWHENSALREAAFGNFAEARRAAAEGLALFPESQGVEAEAALAYAMTGDTHAAELMAERLNKRSPVDTQVQLLWLPAIRAREALYRKNAAEALTILQRVAPPLEFGQIGFVDNLSCLYPAYVHGEAYLAAGQGKAAVAEFQKILDHSGIVWNCWTGAMAHLGIARANALEARTSKGADSDAARVRALSAYEDFLALWKDADPDIPALKAAQTEFAKLQ
jgi:serine/threonine protein kinase/tetratricopeptide (TPR) repeat protein